MANPFIFPHRPPLILKPGDLKPTGQQTQRVQTLCQGNVSHKNCAQYLQSRSFLSTFSAPDDDYMLISASCTVIPTHNQSTVYFSLTLQTQFINFNHFLFPFFSFPLSPFLNYRGWLWIWSIIHRLQQLKHQQRRIKICTLFISVLQGDRQSVLMRHKGFWSHRVFSEVNGINWVTTVDMSCSVGMFPLLIILAYAVIQMYQNMKK